MNKHNGMLRSGLALLVLLGVGMGGVEAGGASFSAEVKRSKGSQGGQAAEGRIFVGEEAIRTESVVNGEPLVVIYHNKNKMVYTVLPAKGQFSRLSDNRLDFNLPPTPRDGVSPCQKDANYQCTLRGREKVEGRECEVWEIRVKGSEKEARTFYLWVDLELGVAIRERYEDGVVVEMKNIRVGVVDGQWFKVPPGFQEVSPPPQRP